MTSISPLNQSIFTDQSSGNKLFSSQDAVATERVAPVTIEAEFVQTGSDEIKQQVDDLFAQANQFAQFSESMSMQSKNGLEAYTALDKANKQDSISQLMGVDIYA